MKGKIVADITMCNDITCHRTGQCYRFTANVNPYRQSYFITSPLKADKSCDEFWLDERFKILRKVKS